MRAVITVIGKDMVGILAKVSALCSEANANIVDVNQTVFQGDLFAMIMLADITSLNCEFKGLADRMKQLGTEMNLQIRMTHEDIFNSMHKI